MLFLNQEINKKNLELHRDVIAKNDEQWNFVGKSNE